MMHEGLLREGGLGREGGRVVSSLTRKVVCFKCTTIQTCTSVVSLRMACFEPNLMRSNAHPT